MMASFRAEIAARASNFWFLFGQCRDLSSKAAFGRVVAVLVAAKLAGILRSRDWHANFSDKEFFLHLKMADLWFDAASAELDTYRAVFSEPEYDLRGQGPEAGEAILDVGANVGLFTIRYSRMFPKAEVYSFEPNPGVYKRLLRNIEANGLTNVVAINAAVCDSAGIRPFFVGRVTVTGSMIQNRDRATEPAFYTEVVNLDAFCKARSIASIALLKIDVEGAEMEVLRGAQNALQVTRALMIECHSDELAASVGHFLAARGFAATFRSIHWEGLSVVHFGRVGAVPRAESNPTVIDQRV